MNLKLWLRTGSISTGQCAEISKPESTIWLSGLELRYAEGHGRTWNKGDPRSGGLIWGGESGGAEGDQWWGRMGQMVGKPECYQPGPMRWRQQGIQVNVKYICAVWDWQYVVLGELSLAFIKVKGSFHPKSHPAWGRTSLHAHIIPWANFYHSLNTLHSVRMWGPSWLHLLLPQPPAQYTCP